MKEADRVARNNERLHDCHPKFATRLRGTLDALEASGFRPRIQDAWRSKQDQLIAFNSGHSKVKFGFHNATAKDGKKMALAADVLDDNNPLDPPTRYLLALAIAAQDNGLDTGVLWRREGQPPLSEAEAAIKARNIEAHVHVGWDPTHVQVVGVTLRQAEAGDFSGVA